MRFYTLIRPVGLDAFTETYWKGTVGLSETWKRR